MHLLRLNQSEIDAIQTRFGQVFLVVESQPYGQREDWFYHALVSDKNATRIIVAGFGTKIEDKGRTIGMWQNLAAQGIHHPERVAENDRVPARLHKHFARMPQGKISIKGNTWAEIFSLLPNSRMAQMLKQVVQ